MYNVLIVEDDPMARKLLEIFVATSDQYHLVPSLDSAAMAELYCMTNQVDLILMDVCTAMDANGIEAAEKLKKLYPQIKIIIIQPAGVQLHRPCPQDRCGELLVQGAYRRRPAEGDGSHHSR